MASMILPDIAVIGGGLLLGVSIMFNIMQIFSLRQNPIANCAVKAARGAKRLAVIHYPSGQCEYHIPEQEKEMGNAAPIWRIAGTLRFKDGTGEKWESCGDIKILNYTAKSPTPISNNQATALDNLSDELGRAGFTTKGIRKELFYMITESAKGKRAEMEAWERLGVKDQETIQKINDILTYIKTHPEIRYMMFKQGAYTYQTAVSVIDQITADTIVETSGMVSFIEDRVRRKLADRFDNLAKYAMLIIPIIFVSAIAGVVFLVGTGIIKVGGS